MLDFPVMLLTSRNTNITQPGAIQVEGCVDPYICKHSQMLLREMISVSTSKEFWKSWVEHFL